MNDDLINTINMYEVLTNDTNFTVRIPKKLRDDFNEATSNKSTAKVMRKLMIEYIYNERNKNNEII